MKDCKKLFLINNILLGLISLAIMFYRGALSIALFFISSANKIIIETDLEAFSKQCLSFFGVGALYAAVFYIIFVIVNYFLFKNNNIKWMRALLVTGFFLYIFNILLIIRLFD